MSGLPVTRRQLVAGTALALPLGAAGAQQAAARSPHGLVAEEIARWTVPEANQAAAVDAGHFYGIGNRTIVKHRKSDGVRAGIWQGAPDGPIVHFNAPAMWTATG